MRTSMPVLAVAAIALAVSSCGAQQEAAKRRNAYVVEVNRAQSDFGRTFRTLSQRISSATTPDQGRRTLRRLEAAVDGVIVGLRRIDAPPDLRGLHRRLIRQIGLYGAEIHRAEIQFATGSPQRSLRSEAALSRASTRLNERIRRTIAAINRRLQRSS
jgi:hypothetical protein